MSYKARRINGRMAKTQRRAAHRLSSAQARMRWTQTLDSDHTCLRVVCDDGSTSYPLLTRPLSMGPRSADENARLAAIVADYIDSGAAATRIPDCPLKPRV